MLLASHDSVQVHGSMLDTAAAAAGHRLNVQLMNMPLEVAAEHVQAVEMLSCAM